MKKTWLLSKSVPEVTSVDELRCLLLSSRGLESNNTEIFFDPEYQAAIHDPFELYQMQIAIDRIYTAVKKNQPIVVYGDYDADGITSTAILVTALRAIGATVTPYLPHRLDDGYGLKMALAQQLSKEAKLIITVDCGVANLEEIAWLKKAKVDVIVVDHHEMKSELPVALAVLHPRHPDGVYPYGFLCGAGMAWKLAQGLLRDRKAPESIDMNTEKWLLDLAMLGTIADIVPLLGENRSIVQFGLEVLRRTKRPGLQALMVIANVQPSSLTAKDVGFKLIPRLNAPGRIEHSQPALDLLLADDAARAFELAKVLEKYNQTRQTVGRKVAKEAEEQVVLDADVVFAYNIDWPAGVVGLAANQLAKKFGRPAIVVGGNGRHAVGSARTPKGFNILGILEPHKEQFMAMGGHAHAAGFSLLPDSVDALKKVLLARSVVSEDDDATLQVAESILHQSLISWDTVQLLTSFEPFGEGNKEPQFIFKRLPLISSRTVGKQANHAKFVFDVQGKKIEGIGFSLATELPSLGQYVDVLGTPTVTHFRGQSRLELLVQDIAPAGKVTIQPKEAVFTAEAA